MNSQNEFQPEQTLSETEMTGSSLSTSAKKSNARLFIILGSLLAGLCLCVVISITCTSGMLFTMLRGIYTEQPNVESVLDAFMNAMANQNAYDAYSLFSARAKRNVSLSDMEKGLAGNNFTLYEGYQSLEITDFTLNYTSDPDPDMPQGEVAQVQGTITYTDGFTGDFTAILEKDGDEWRLYGYNVSVPPDKFGQ